MRGENKNTPKRGLIKAFSGESSSYFAPKIFRCHPRPRLPKNLPACTKPASGSLAEGRRFGEGRFGGQVHSPPPPSKGGRGWVSGFLEIEGDTENFLPFIFMYPNPPHLEHIPSPLFVLELKTSPI